MQLKMGQDAISLKKHYGGNASFGAQGAMPKANEKTSKAAVKTEAREAKTASRKTDKDDFEDYRKAGRIAKQAVEYAKSIIKKGMPLLDAAEKIENKII